MLISIGALAFVLVEKVVKGEAIDEGMGEGKVLALSPKPLNTVGDFFPDPLEKLLAKIAISSRALEGADPSAAA